MDLPGCWHGPALMVSIPRRKAYSDIQRHCCRTRDFTAAVDWMRRKPSYALTLRLGRAMRPILRERRGAPRWHAFLMGQGRIWVAISSSGSTW